MSKCVGCKWYELYRFLNRCHLYKREDYTEPEECDCFSPREEFTKAEFKDAVKPVHEWLCKHGHPHTVVIVDQEGAQFFEGVCAERFNIPD